MNQTGKALLVVLATIAFVVVGVVALGVLLLAALCLAIVCALGLLCCCLGYAIAMAGKWGFDRGMAGFAQLQRAALWVQGWGEQLRVLLAPIPDRDPAEGPITRPAPAESSTRISHQGGSHHAIH